MMSYDVKVLTLYQLSLLISVTAYKTIPVNMNMLSTPK